MINIIELLNTELERVQYNLSRKDKIDDVYNMMEGQRVLLEWLLYKVEHSSEMPPWEGKGE